METVAKISPGSSERKQTLLRTTEGLPSSYFKKSTSDGKQCCHYLWKMQSSTKVLARLAVVWTYWWALLGILLPCHWAKTFSPCEADCILVQALESYCVCPCAQWYLTFSQPHGLYSTRLLCAWNSVGKNTGMGSYSFLQGIFPTQGSNSGLLHCKQVLYHLSQQGSPYDHIIFWSQSCHLLTQVTLTKFTSLASVLIFKIGTAIVYIT